MTSAVVLQSMHGSVALIPGTWAGAEAGCEPERRKEERTRPRSDGSSPLPMEAASCEKEDQADEGDGQDLPGNELAEAERGQLDVLHAKVGCGAGRRRETRAEVAPAPGPPQRTV